MADIPVHLQYRLTRRQRLLPHIRLCGTMGPIGLIILASFAIRGVATSSLWFILFAFAVLWFLRGYIRGLLDATLHRYRDMDVIIDPLGIGFLLGTERWWVCLDGVRSIQLISGVWTILHRNGTVIDVPSECMPGHCVEHIRATVDGGWEYLRPFADARKSEFEKTA